MAISSVKEAEEYYLKLHRTLLYLAELSGDAGLNSYAKMFCEIGMAVSLGVDESNRLVSMIAQYAEKEIIPKGEKLFEGTQEA